jgi:hypothetical protein
MKLLKALPILLILLLSGCSNPKPLFLIYIVDVSASARGDTEFVKGAKKVCHSMVSAAKVKDLYSYIEVDAGISPLSEPTSIDSQDAMHADCNKELQPTISKEMGTFPCLAWDQALKLIDRVDASKYTPVLINQIQANELDQQCAQTVTSLVLKIKETQGRFIIIGNDEKEHADNDWLAKELENYQSFVKFYRTAKAEQSIEDEIKSVRQIGDK